MKQKNRTLSSKRWLLAHQTDIYVKQAKNRRLRSRAWFKLEQLQESDRLFKPGMVVVDLGAAPGGWSQYAAMQVGLNGCVIACDRLHMDPLDNVIFVQGDFSDPLVLTNLLKLVGYRKAAVVLSDISPNLTGVSAIDQAHSMYLADMVLIHIQKFLVTQGTLVIKIFHGSNFNEYLNKLRSMFSCVRIRKPLASRSTSSEVYMVASGYKL